MESNFDRPSIFKNTEGINSSDLEDLREVFKNSASYKDNKKDELYIIKDELYIIKDDIKLNRNIEEDNFNINKKNIPSFHFYSQANELEKLEKQNSFLAGEALMIRRIVLIIIRGIKTIEEDNTRENRFYCVNKLLDYLEEGDRLKIFKKYISNIMKEVFKECEEGITLLIFKILEAEIYRDK